MKLDVRIMNPEHKYYFKFVSEALFCDLDNIDNLVHCLSHETIHFLLSELICEHANSSFHNIIRFVPEEFFYAGF